VAGAIVGGLIIGRREARRGLPRSMMGGGIENLVRLRGGAAVPAGPPQGPVRRALIERSIGEASVLYREAGQFKATTRPTGDLPIAQDRFVMLALLAVAFLVVPAGRQRIRLSRRPIPVVILSLAAIGLNVLMGYCGQVRWAWPPCNGDRGLCRLHLAVRLPFLNLFLCILLSGFVAAGVGILFGVPACASRASISLCHARRAVLPPTGFPAREWFTNTRRGLRERPPLEIWASDLSSPPPPTWSRWLHLVLGSPPRTSCAAISGGMDVDPRHGHRPRSSACGRCMPSSRVRRLRPS